MSLCQMNYILPPLNTFLFIRFLTKIVEQNKCRYKSFFFLEGEIEKAIVKVYIQSTHI